MSAQNTRGDCFNCERADLQPADIQLAGTVRGDVYPVRMRGLRCPNCGYETIEGSDTPEFSRLLADEYRRAHGLLTSQQIVELRNKLGMTQVEFANHVGVSIASLKRWELGKIQEQASNDRIVEGTKRPVTSMSEYSFSTSGSTTAIQCYAVDSATFVEAFLGAPAPEEIVFINDLAEEFRCPNCRQTAAATGMMNEIPATTVPPFMASLLIRRGA
jgi:putative zinc finger/helix-turn-helix YgiT family protein